MRLFLDCEFNEFGGDLISMAIVSECDREFYEVVAIPEKPGSFVAEHVLPKLEKQPIGFEAFDLLLAEFFRDAADEGCEIVADWPADFEHLNSAFSRAGRNLGWKLPLECTMRLVRGDDTIAPENPHNALSDARALHDWWKRQQPFGHPAEDQWISSGQRRI